MNKIIVIDESRCLGCKQCMLSCAMVHNKAETLAEAFNNEDMEPRVRVEPVGSFGVPLQCQHCEDAPCIEICPVDAMERGEVNGLVLLNKDKCIGCKLCLMACPFGVLTVRRTGKTVIKCDMCVERRNKEGLHPGCVEACPTKAVKLCDIEEWLENRRMHAAEKIAAGETLAQKIDPE